MGVRVLAHAGLKLFIFTPVGTAGYFDSLGLPGPLADLVVAAEFFGGIGLILGLNIAARYPDASFSSSDGSRRQLAGKFRNSRDGGKCPERMAQRSSLVRDRGARHLLGRAGRTMAKPVRCCARRDRDAAVKRQNLLDREVLFVSQNRQSL